MLDLAVLDAQPIAKMLGSMFRNKATVKITFNAAADLRAIAKALKYYGPSTVARVEPLCEIGAQHSLSAVDPQQWSKRLTQWVVHTQGKASGVFLKQQQQQQHLFSLQVRSTSS